MGLFSYNQIPEPVVQKPTLKGKAKADDGSQVKKHSQETFNTTSEHILGRSLAQLKQFMPGLQHNATYHYATGGRWSMHELILHILDTIGPATMYLSTWTITEEPLRALFSAVEKKMITEIYAVLDYRIEKRKAEAFQFAQGITSSVKLAKCHAKVTVLQNDAWSVTIVSSANMTNNPRIEAGVICTDLAAAEFHKQWIIDVICGEEPLKNK